MKNATIWYEGILIELLSIKAHKLIQIALIIFLICNATISSDMKQN